MKAIIAFAFLITNIAGFAIVLIADAKSICTSQAVGYSLLIAMNATANIVAASIARAKREEWATTHSLPFPYFFTA